jgi:hypothetical protein
MATVGDHGLKAQYSSDVAGDGYWARSGEYSTISRYRRGNDLLDGTSSAAKPDAFLCLVEQSALGKTRGVGTFHFAVCR